MQLNSATLSSVQSAVSHIMVQQFLTAWLYRG